MQFLRRPFSKQTYGFQRHKVDVSVDTIATIRMVKILPGQKLV